MQKKYELLADDSVLAGTRQLYRIRALRDFGDVRKGDLGGFVESEDHLSHEGGCWVYDIAQVYGPGAVVRDNAKVRGEAWVLGCVEGDAIVDDLVIVAQGARVCGREILLYDEIARGIRPEGVMQPSVHVDVWTGEVRKTQKNAAHPAKGTRRLVWG
jgi:hypothetical protein